MRKFMRVMAVTVVAVAASIGLTAPSLADTAATWTVTPGGSFTAAAFVDLFDQTTRAQIQCESDLTGTFKSGSGLSGTGVGAVTSLTINSPCDGVTVNTGKVKWPLNVSSYNAAKGITSGSLHRIHFATTGTCSFVVDGTSDTANDGTVRIKFYNTTGKQLHTVITPAATNLHIYDVSGCSTINYHSGDPAILDADYGLSSGRQTITSP